MIIATDHNGIIATNRQQFDYSYRPQRYYSDKQTTIFIITTDHNAIIATNRQQFRYGDKQTTMTKLTNMSRGKQMFTSTSILNNSTGVRSE